MHIVGHHLQKKALSVDAEQRDAYARSAYNRYYYSTFLITRQMVKDFDPSKNLGHADYPHFLRATLTKELSTAQRVARRMGDKALESKLKEGKHAAAALANQFEKANGLRITADYHPDTLIDFEGSDRFSLNKIDVTEAHQWAENTKNFVRVIQRALDLIHA